MVMMHDVVFLFIFCFQASDAEEALRLALADDVTTQNKNKNE